MNKKSAVAGIFLSTVKTHPLLCICTLCTLLLSVALSVLPPLVLEKIINLLAQKEPLSLGAAALYFLAVSASGLTDAARGTLVTAFGQKTTHALRRVMSDKLNRLPAGFFTTNEPGAVSSIFVNDVGAVESLFTSGVLLMAADLLKLSGILYVIFLRSKGLALMLAAFSPLIFWMTRRFQKATLKAQMENRAAVAGINQLIPEALDNIGMIRLYGKEAYMLGRYENAIEQSFRAQEKNNVYDSIYSPIIKSLSALIVGVLMALSARDGVWQSFFSMSPGAAAAVIAYVGSFFGPLESIGTEIQSVQSAVSGLKRVNAFLNEREMEKSSVPSSETPFAVDIENLTFRYREEDAPVLNGLNLKVAPGETVVLSGRTGAGKSTLIKLIVGLYQPSEGVVRVFGRAPDALPEKERRRVFGYVEQRFRPVPGTLADQVSLHDPSLGATQVERALRLVGLWDDVLRLPLGCDTPCREGLLSQGQFELLSIARAVVADPQLLLLDEITADLDANTERKVLSALRAASRGRTVISVSHRLYTLSDGAHARLITL